MAYAFFKVSFCSIYIETHGCPGGNMSEIEVNLKKLFQSPF